MSTFPQEPTSVSQEIDQAFFDFMIEKWYYIREGTWVHTNPQYEYSYEALIAEWMKIKKDRFGTTSNTPQQWTTTSKAKKASSR